MMYPFLEGGMGVFKAADNHGAAHRGGDHASRTLLQHLVSVLDPILNHGQIARLESANPGSLGTLWRQDTTIPSGPITKHQITASSV